MKFRLPQWFSLSVTCTYMHVLLDVGCCCFPRNDIFLNMMLFVGSQSFISLPSFMFVSAAVSEQHKSNQNMEKEEKIILKSAISN